MCMDNKGIVLSAQKSKRNVTAVYVWPSTDAGVGSLSTKPGDCGAATVFFTRYLVVIPQPAHRPRRMQRNSPKKTTTTTTTPRQTARKVKYFDIPVALRDDPAFSQDPLVNPFFAQHNPPDWSFPPPSSDPTPKRPETACLLDDDAFQIIQRPSSPAVTKANSHGYSTGTTAPFFISSPQSNPPAKTIDTLPLPDSTSLVSPLPKPVSHPLASSLSASSPSHVHSKDDMPHDAHQLPQPPPKPEPKKRVGLFARLLGAGDPPQSTNKTSTPSSSSNSGITSSAQHRLPQDMPPIGPRPIPQHNPTAPELFRSERPVPPSRAQTTAGAPSEPRIRPALVAAPGQAASSRAPDDRRTRQELDMIDELDETNPFGAKLHQGGPYEGISKFVQSVPLVPQSHKVQAGPSAARNMPMSHDAYRNAQLYALEKGSLRLKPGQILPRTLYPKAAAQPSQHQEHRRHQAYDFSDGHVHASESRPSWDGPAPPQIASSHLRPPASGEYARIEHESTTNDRPRHLVPSAVARNSHGNMDEAAFSIGMAMLDGRISSQPSSSNAVAVANPDHKHDDHVTGLDNYENAAETTRMKQDSPPNSVGDHEKSPEEPGQDPTLQSNDFRDDMRNNIPLQPSEPPAYSTISAPVPKRASQASLLYQDPPYQGPPYQGPPPPQQYVRPVRQEIRSFEPPPSQHSNLPLNNILNRSATYTPSVSSRQVTDRSMLVSAATNGAAPQPRNPYPPDREIDARSVQQSVMTNSNASNRSQASDTSRRNRFLPKRLVMPTPLQPTLQNQGYGPGQNQPAMHHIHWGTAVVNGAGFPNNQKPYRDPSPPHVKPLPLASAQQIRAQDIPIAPSNKLKKRMSLLGGFGKGKDKSAGANAPPVAAVSFAADILPPMAKTAVSTKSAQKKVLSKRK